MNYYSCDFLRNSILIMITQVIKEVMQIDHIKIEFVIFNLNFVTIRIH